MAAVRSRAHRASPSRSPNPNASDCSRASTPSPKPSSTIRRSVATSRALPRGSCLNRLPPRGPDPPLTQLSHLEATSRCLALSLRLFIEKRDDAPNLDFHQLDT